MSLTLEWNNEQTEVEISPQLIEKLHAILQKAGESENITSGEVALSFVNDEEIRQLNKGYREIDRPTDVLSFAMREGEHGMPEQESFPEFPEMLGDIIISAPRAREQSEEYGHSMDREIGFLFVHGFLHLIGYDHHDESSEKLMFSKQESILEDAGLTR
jgi:probable rRNA maturation factor